MLVSKRHHGNRIPHSLAIAAACLLALSVFAGIQERKNLEIQEKMAIAQQSLESAPAPLKQSKGFKMTLFLFRQN